MTASEKAVKKCQACAYFNPAQEATLGKCFRFARFVDHVITEHTKDCEYWSSEENPNAPMPKPY
jgi:hypothetical protein